MHELEAEIAALMAENAEQAERIERLLPVDAATGLNNLANALKPSAMMELADSIMADVKYEVRAAEDAQHLRTVEAAAMKAELKARSARNSAVPEWVCAWFTGYAAELRALPRPEGESEARDA